MSGWGMSTLEGRPERSEAYGMMGRLNKVLKEIAAELAEGKEPPPTSRWPLWALNRYITAKVGFQTYIADHWQLVHYSEYGMVSAVVPDAMYNWIQEQLWVTARAGISEKAVKEEEYRKRHEEWEER